METDAGAEMLESLLPSKFQYRAKEVKNLEQDEILALLLCSTYFWSWLIQLTKSYKNNGKIVRTGISTLNGHISKLVALRKKLKKINCNYISILGLSRWFRNFPQVSHFSPNMPPRLVRNGKFFFCNCRDKLKGLGPS